MTAGERRKASAELSDRHTDLADKAGAAYRRGWALQTQAGHCSMEAAAAYHEAGRALIELQGECSRGALKLARARAQLSADCAARLRKLADAWATPQELYLAFNSVYDFADREGALDFKKNRDSEGRPTDAVLETREDWEARTGCQAHNRGAIAGLPTP